MEPTDPEVVELGEDLHARLPLDGWSVWRGVNGVLYARPFKRSPPVVFRGRSKKSLLAQIGEWIATGRRPDDLGEPT